MSNIPAGHLTRMPEYLKEVLENCCEPLNNLRTSERINPDGTGSYLLHTAKLGLVNCKDYITLEIDYEKGTITFLNLTPWWGVGSPKATYPPNLEDFKIILTRLIRESQPLINESQPLINKDKQTPLPLPEYLKQALNDFCDPVDMLPTLELDNLDGATWYYLDTSKFKFPGASKYAIGFDIKIDYDNATIEINRRGSASAKPIKGDPIPYPETSKEFKTLLVKLLREP